MNLSDEDFGRQVVALVQDAIDREDYLRGWAAARLTSGEDGEPQITIDIFSSPEGGVERSFTEGFFDEDVNPRKYNLTPHEAFDAGGWEPFLFQYVSTARGRSNDGASAKGDALG